MNHAARPRFPDPVHRADPPRVLVVFAHPRAHHAPVHAALRGAAAATPGVSVEDLYERYPDGGVDPVAEQQLLDAHAAVVLQHPLIWYSVPPLLKEWLDATFAHGWAYGPGGDRLAGKPLLQAVTTRGAAADFRAGGPHGAPLDALLAPVTQTAVVCGMRPQAPFAVYAAHTLDAAGVADAARAYRARLDALVAALPAGGPP